MIVKKYGIELHRLTQNDLELVRQKRNDKTIREKMFYQKEITKQEQQAWFETINNNQNYYFIIKYKGKKIGLISGEILSYEKKIGTGGIFIWNPLFENSHIPVIASICLADMTFLILKMKKTTAKVRMDNKVAIDYNLKLGYEIVQEIGEKGMLKMELTVEDYFNKANELRRLVKKISGDNTDLLWEDVTFPKEDMDNLYQGLPVYLQERIDQIRNND